MELEHLKSVMKNLNNFTEEPEEDIEPKSDIYDVLKILDSFKKEDALKRVYKTDFHYDRNGNTISLIFKIDNFRKAKEFGNVFNSEYIQKLFKELETLNVSQNLIRKLRNKGNYKLSLHGNIGIYQTPYFKVV